MSLDPPNALEVDQSIVTFEVGEQAKAFRIHQSIVSDVSPFFTKAFKSEFKEGKQKKMSLADVDPDVFKVIGHWFYTRKLPPFNGTLYSSRRAIKDGGGNEVELVWEFLLSSSYVFAEMYDVRQLGVDILHRYRERYKSREESQKPTTAYPRATTIARVFDNVREDAPLCQLFVERFSEHWDFKSAPAVDKKLFEKLPPHFFLKCMIKFSEKLMGPSDASGRKADKPSSRLSLGGSGDNHSPSNNG